MCTCCGVAVDVVIRVFDLIAAKFIYCTLYNTFWPKCTVNQCIEKIIFRKHIVHVENNQSTTYLYVCWFWKVDLWARLSSNSMKKKISSTIKQRKKECQRTLAGRIQWYAYTISCFAFQYWMILFPVSSFLYSKFIDLSDVCVSASTKYKSVLIIFIVCSSFVHTYLFVARHHFSPASVLTLFCYIALALSLSPTVRSIRSVFPFGLCFTPFVLVLVVGVVAAAVVAAEIILSHVRCAWSFRVHTHVHKHRYIHTHWWLSSSTIPIFIAHMCVRVSSLSWYRQRHR